MTRSRSMRGPIHLALAVVGAAALLLGACSSDTTPNAKANRPADHPPVGKGKGTPDAPRRDGSLEKISLKLTRVAHLDTPTALVTRTGHPDSLYASERPGRIRRLALADRKLTVEDKPLIDVSNDVTTDGEMGLLGLTFSPDGSKLYFDYNSKDGWTHLVRYDMDGDTVLTATRFELFKLAQPFPNHKGGDVHFGPDGMLYFGLGDGGSANDPDQRAQNLKDFHGKLLRFKPDGGAPEIYLLGLRNPWRFSFDAVTHDLWIGDVGQDHIEEIDHLPAGQKPGGNMGWSGMEGTRVNIPSRVVPNTIAPVFQYSHDDGGCAITGGFVYRGTRIPALQGVYLFADLCLPAIHGLKVDSTGKVVDERSLGIQSDQIISFAQGDGNEIYVLSLEGGVFRIDPAT